GEGDMFGWGKSSRERLGGAPTPVALADARIPRTLARLPALEGDDVLPLLAESGDAERHDVARLEIDRLGFHPQPHARRRARRDDIAWKQRHVLRDVRHEIGHAEDHGARVAALALLTVHVEPEV